MNELEVYEDMPEGAHIETMFNGLTDAVSGVESYNTRYAQGVLLACGMTSFREVAGNEGFFSSIGDGIKKVFEYIVNMFKSIWNWITGGSSSSKSTASRAKAVETTAKKTLDKKVTEQNAPGILKLIDIKASQLNDPAVKQEIQREVENILNGLKESIPKETQELLLKTIGAVIHDENIRAEAIAIKELFEVEFVEVSAKIEEVLADQPDAVNEELESLMKELGVENGGNAQVKTMIKMLMETVEAAAVDITKIPLVLKQIEMATGYLELQFQKLGKLKPGVDKELKEAKAIVDSLKGSNDPSLPEKQKRIKMLQAKTVSISFVVKVFSKVLPLFDRVIKGFGKAMINV